MKIAGMKYKFGYGLAVVAALLLVYNAWVFVPVMSALKGESDVKVWIYRNCLLDPSTIVFDLKRVSPHASMADVDRNLFSAAEALKDRHYKTVILAYKGSGRFKLDGDRFQIIGQERDFQNPIYVVRTLTHDISSMDGTEAFPIYTGGWLGVMTKEMEQHNELHMLWYGKELVGET